MIDKMDPERVCYFLWELRNISESARESQITSTTEGLRYSSFVISVITCILGLVGNSVVIWVTGFKMKKGKAITWFLNLAVADLVFLLCLPMKAITLFIGQWYFGLFLCKTYHFLSNLNMYVSIFILTALTIDRCLSVALPLWHLKFVTKHFSRWVCLLVWTLTMVMSIPSLIFGQVDLIGNTTHCTVGFYRSNSFSNLFLNSSECPSNTILIDRTQGEAVIRELSDAIKHKLQVWNLRNLPLDRQECQNETFKKTMDKCIHKEELVKLEDMLTFSERLVIPLLIFGFLIPLVIITLSNIIIAIQGQRTLRKTSTKLYTIIVVMVATYFFAWTPLAVVETVFIIAARKMDLLLMNIMGTVLPLVSSISSFHSCLNPILYVLLSGAVRKNMTESLNRVWLRLNSRSAKTSQTS